MWLYAYIKKSELISKGYFVRTKLDNIDCIVKILKSPSIERNA